MRQKALSRFVKTVTRSIKHSQDTGAQNTNSGITSSVKFALDAVNRSAVMIPSRDMLFVLNAGKSFFLKH
jgi:hypothetical protein